MRRARSSVVGEPVEQRAGPMTRATLLFLGASVSQLPAIRYALDAGYRVAAADGEATAPGLALAHASTAIDFSDVERVAEWAESIRVDGILAISTDRGVVPAAAIAAKLGLPGIGIDVARAMTDKARMRATLAAGGIRQPRHRVARTGAELERALGELRLPVVMKPADSGGQRGDGGGVRRGNWAERPRCRSRGGGDSAHDLRRFPPARRRVGRGVDPLV